MILKTCLTTPKKFKLSKSLIEQNFGEQLRARGFIPHNGGTEWYAVKANKLFFSVYFQEDFLHDILYRVQPFCNRILHPLKKYEGGSADRANFCESALGFWKQSNSELYDKLYCIKLDTLTDDEVMPKKINFYRELINTVVFPYFDNVNDFGDIKCFSDREIISSVAYLNSDADAYYESQFVAQALSDLHYDEARPEEETDLKSSIRKAAESRDMSLVGRCLQKWEIQNINYLKSKLPGLFRDLPDITPFITDDFIGRAALNEVRTTYDYKLSIPQSVEKITGVDYLPFPMSAPKPVSDSAVLRKKHWRSSRIIFPVCSVPAALFAETMLLNGIN